MLESIQAIAAAIIPSCEVKKVTYSTHNSHITSVKDFVEVSTLLLNIQLI